MENDPADAEFCLNLLQSSARDLYLSDLLLPNTFRSPVVTIHAFHVEISNISLSVGEPTAGEIRLQWWMDVINGQREHEASGHPVARSLLDLIKKYNFQRESFVAKLEAHIFDLYQDPMGDRTMFEGYCGETRSCLFQWAGLISGAEAGSALANASGHAGVATGIVNLLESMMHLHNHGKIHVPGDLLAASGMTGDQFLGSPSRLHENAVLGLVDLAREHEEKAVSALSGLTATTRTVFKPLALVPLYLARIERDPLTVFSPRPPLSQLRCQWALWRF